MENAVPSATRSRQDVWWFYRGRRNRSGHNPDHRWAFDNRPELTRGKRGV